MKSANARLNRFLGRINWIYFGWKYTYQKCVMLEEANDFLPETNTDYYLVFNNLSTWDRYKDIKYKDALLLKWPNKLAANLSVNLFPQAFKVITFNKAKSISYLQKYITSTRPVFFSGASSWPIKKFPTPYEIAIMARITFEILERGYSIFRRRAQKWKTV